MRSGSRAAAALALLLCSAGAWAVDPAVPSPQGWVTDTAGVVTPAIAARIAAVCEELQRTTGAEIAVLTVETTAPLDDFSYALKVAETWRPSRKGEDLGIVFLVAVRDRKLRILTGYGLEGILPDGLVGEISDTEVVPAFREGRIDEGILRGVIALASRIAEARGVTLTGIPPPRPRARLPAPPPAAVLLGVIVLVILLYALSKQSRRRRWYLGPGFGGGFGGGFGSGFGGGGGGFGGFGGSGGFGGGGAGRSW